MNTKKKQKKRKRGKGRKYVTTMRELEDDHASTITETSLKFAKNTSTNIRSEEDLATYQQDEQFSSKQNAEVSKTNGAISKTNQPQTKPKATTPMSTIEPTLKHSKNEDHCQQNASDFKGTGAIPKTNLKKVKKPRTTANQHKEKQATKQKNSNRIRECGICMENIMAKPYNERRFGLLSNCNHIFCYSCISLWSESSRELNILAYFVEGVTCPVCRVISRSITPSNDWVPTEHHTSNKETNTVKLNNTINNIAEVLDYEYFWDIADQLWEHYHSENYHSEPTETYNLNLETLKLRTAAAEHALNLCSSELFYADDDTYDTCDSEQCNCESDYNCDKSLVLTSDNNNSSSWMGKLVKNTTIICVLSVLAYAAMKAIVR